MADTNDALPSTNSFPKQRLPTMEDTTNDLPSRKDSTFRITESIVRREMRHQCTNDDKLKASSYIFSWTHHIPIFLPFGEYMCYWNTFLLIILLFSIVEIPYQIAMEIIPQSLDPLAIITLFIDVCLLFDIVLTFRTAYIDKYDRLRIIHDPVLIAKRYVRKWFVIDLLSSFPFTFVFLLLSDNHQIIPLTLQYLRLLRVLKLLRIIKLFKVFHLIQQITHSLYHLNRGQRTLLKLLKIICSMLIIAHWFACIWYAIGNYGYKNDQASWIDVIVDNGDEDKGNFTKYSYAFYWAIVTLFTTGYGDISANNIYEQWVASICIIFGSCLFAYFIGVLTNGLNEDLNHQKSAERMEESLLFCSYYNLPQELRHSVLTNVKYFNDYNFNFDCDEIMNSLPRYLQKEIDEHLKISRLRDLDLFKSFPSEITGQIALKLKSKSCGFDKILFERGDVAKELYIQRTGRSKLTKFDGTSRETRRGDVIGEDAIISKQRRCTVRCSTWSEFFVLNVDDILCVLKENYCAHDAKQKWLSIQQMIRNPVTKDVDDSHNSHRHCVRFGTVPDFEEYVPMEALDEESPKHKRNKSYVMAQQLQKEKNEQFDEYERKLERETELEDKEHNEKYKSMRKLESIINLFGNNVQIKKRNSLLRNEKIVENHEKIKKSSTYSWHKDNNGNTISKLSVGKYPDGLLYFDRDDGVENEGGNDDEIDSEKEEEAGKTSAVTKEETQEVEMNVLDKLNDETRLNKIEDETEDEESELADVSAVSKEESVKYAD